MKRRDFVRLGWATMIAAGADKLRPAFGGQVLGLPQHAMVASLDCRDESNLNFANIPDRSPAGWACSEPRWQNHPLPQGFLPAQIGRLRGNRDE